MPPPGTYFIGYGGSPDTSFITFTNTGTTTFVGTLADVAVAGMGGGFDYSLSVSSWTLTPGQSTVFGTSPELSNVGGLNGPGGIVVEVNGVFSDGYSSGLWSVSDSNIHSGVINGGGLTDAFVLQGLPVGLRLWRLHRNKPGSRHLHVFAHVRRPGSVDLGFDAARIWRPRICGKSPDPKANRRGRSLRELV